MDSPPRSSQQYCWPRLLGALRHPRHCWTLLRLSWRLLSPRRSIRSELRPRYQAQIAPRRTRCRLIFCLLHLRFRCPRRNRKPTSRLPGSDDLPPFMLNPSSERFSIFGARIWATYVSSSSGRIQFRPPATAAHVCPPQRSSRSAEIWFSRETGLRVSLGWRQSRWRSWQLILVTCMHHG